MADAIQNYFDYLKTEGRHRNTIDRYRIVLNHLNEFCRQKRVHLLRGMTPVIFDDFRASRREFIKPGTMYYEGMITKQFLKWCVSRRLLLVNPLQGIPITKPRSTSQPAPTIEEINMIYRASPERDQMMIAFLMATGM